MSDDFAVDGKVLAELLKTLPDGTAGGDLVILLADFVAVSLSALELDNNEYRMAIALLNWRIEQARAMCAQKTPLH